MLSGDLHGVGDSSRPTVGSLTAQRLGGLCLKSNCPPSLYNPPGRHSARECVCAGNTHSGAAMPRHYVRLAKIDDEPDAEHYLARTVYESHELIDIGILDEDGNKIMAHERMDEIGFIRWRNDA